MAKRSKKKPALIEAQVSEKTASACATASAWQPALLKAALIIAAGLWVFSPAFHGDWLWDDDWYITQQPMLRNAAGLWAFWFQPGTWVEFYPVEETVLWIEWHLWGLDTLGYHLVTVVLHLVNALMVWRLLDKLGLRKAWLGGLIFAVHPVVVDSVAWMVELKNTLSLLPFLAAMCAWINYDERRKPHDYGLALGLFVVALLCKITPAPFPLLILLYAWWKRRRLVRNDMVVAAPFFVVSLVLGIMTIACGTYYNAHRDKLPDAVALGGFFSRMALAGESLAHYVAHCFWPVTLLPIYPQWPIEATSPLPYLPWLALAGAICWSWIKRESWGRHVLLGLGFFLLFLLPFLGFNSVSYQRFTWIMDHFLYVPLIGLVGLVVAGIGALENRLPEMRTIITAAVTAVVALLAFVAHGYAVAYSDEATLWGYTVEHNPGSWMAHDNLGKALVLLNQPDDALVHFQEVAKLRPERAQSHLSLGRALVETGRLPEGIEEYDRSIALDPHDPEIYNQKGVALLQLKRFPEALVQFEKAMELRPGYAIALQNEGSALAQMGRMPEAIDRFTAALKLTPDDASAHDNLGNALLQAGRTAEADTQYREALLLNPDDPRARQHLNGNAK